MISFVIIYDVCLCHTVHTVMTMIVTFNCRRDHTGMRQPQHDGLPLALALPTCHVRIHIRPCLLSIGGLPHLVTRLFLLALLPFLALAPAYIALRCKSSPPTSLATAVTT